MITSAFGAAFADVGARRVVPRGRASLLIAANGVYGFFLILVPWIIIVTQPAAGTAITEETFVVADGRLDTWWPLLALFMASVVGANQAVLARSGERA